MALAHCYKRTNKDHSSATKEGSTNTDIARRKLSSAIVLGVLEQTLTSMEDDENKASQRRDFPIMCPF